MNTLPITCVAPRRILKILWEILKDFYKHGFTKSIKAWSTYFSDLKNFKMNAGTEFIFGNLYHCLTEKYANSGTARGGYFHQDLLVARRIFENNPQCHIDIGSRIDGFIAHVASFRQIYVIDIRPPENNMENIIFIQQDFMLPLKKDMIGYYDSVSCLHALEHFGLGRYGDSLNYNGHLLGLDNLYQLLKRHGKFYFSVPIGIPQRIEFHAHRIFSVAYLLNCFNEKYRIDDFSFVDDEGNLHRNASLTRENIQKNFGVIGDGLSCGIFEMTKL
jgi:hypothetical protein